jgi:lipoyl(octanoyl) transferase
MKILQVMDLGVCAYGKAWEIQKDLHAKRVQNEIPDTLILVEHPHVYTLGKNANAQHLIASQDFLKNRGIEIYHVDRGGDITYHGPGQLVGYPIFNLNDHQKSIGWFVHTVEEVLIQFLAGCEISAGRLEKLTGVWADNRKIAAIGMRVSKWVTMHGFALNVSTDLSLYDGIIPCGITSRGITRIVNYKPEIQMKQVKENIIKKFIEIYGFENESA